MKKKLFDMATIILLALLLLRSFFTFVVGVFATDAFSVIFGVLYFAAFWGIYEKEPWGASLTVILAAIDVLFLLMVGAASVGGASYIFGAVVADVVLILLGSREHGLLSKPKRKQKKKK